MLGIAKKEVELCGPKNKSLLLFSGSEHCFITWFLVQLDPILNSFFGVFLAKDEKGVMAPGKKWKFAWWGEVGVNSVLTYPI